MKVKVLGLVLAGVLLFSMPIQAVQSGNLDREREIKVISSISNHWASEAINKLSEKNAFLFDDQNLGYDVEIKRSEFAKILCVALDIQMNYIAQPNIKDYFDDVEPDAPYVAYVIDLITANIFEANSSFNPDDSLSREEMVNYLMKAYKYKMGEDYEMIKIEEPSFEDADDINPEYSAKISEAQHHKLVLGNGNNKFEPKRNSSRAEVAAVTVRLSDFLSSQNIKVAVEPEIIINEKSMEMKVTIKNDSKQDIFIEFTSGQKFDFQLLDADKNVLWTWSANKLFIQVLKTMEIKAGETITFSDIVNEEEYAEFEDKIVYFKAYITGASSFINQQGYEIMTVNQ